MQIRSSSLPSSSRKCVYTYRNWSLTKRPCEHFLPLCQLRLSVVPLASSLALLQTIMVAIATLSVLLFATFYFKIALIWKKVLLILYWLGHDAYMQFIVVQHFACLSKIRDRWLATWLPTRRQRLFQKWHVYELISYYKEPI